MRNPMKLTTTVLLGLGIAGTASWLATGRVLPEAHAHSTPSDLLVLGDFADVQAMYLTLRQQGVPQDDIAQAVSQWMDVNEWRGLTVGQLGELWNMIYDDQVVTRTECSARWSGQIIAPLTDTYTFSNLFHATQDMQMQVVVNGQLVLQPVPPEALAVSGSTFSEVLDLKDSNPAPRGGGDRRTSIALEAGQIVPIVVQFSVMTPEKNRSWGYPVAMLFWEGENLPRQVVPSGVLSPPEGFVAKGLSGLKAEIFDGPDLKRLVQTRLDANIDLAWVYSPFAPKYFDKQNEILEHLWPKLLAADYEGLVDDTFNDPARVLDRVGSGLNSHQKRQVLDLMNANPEVIQAMDEDLMLSVHTVAKHTPGNAMVDFVANWCEGNWDRCALGAIDGDTRDSYERKNHFASYIVGAWMMTEFPSRLEELKNRCLVRDDGSCNPGVALMIAHGYRQVQDQATWRAYLDDVLADATLTGDARATWLMARASAEELKGWSPQPMAAVDYLNEAIAEAETEAMRLSVVRQLVTRLGSMDKGEQAKAIISSIEASNPDPQVAMELTRWRVEIDNLAIHYEQQRIFAAREAFDAHLAELTRRLASATERGDQENIERYQRLLQTAQQN